MSPTFLVQYKFLENTGVDNSTLYVRNPAPNKNEFVQRQSLWVVRITRNCGRSLRHKEHLRGHHSRRFCGWKLVATVIASPQFRVTVRNITLESRVMDSGQRSKTFVTHAALIYYFIRFGQIGTRHQVRLNDKVTLLIN
jgi:hypothetical protein